MASRSTSVRIGAGRLAARDLRQAEIEHLDDAVVRDLDVGRFEIAVNDALLVRRFERLGDLPRDVQRLTDRDLFDFGQSFDQGILSNLPPVFLGSPYPAFVPRTDADGNDIAGIRLPEIEVPLPTYTGWSLRAAAFAGDDLCDALGQKLHFAQTKAERLALGDPRPLIEERYPTHAKYVRDVTHAAKRLFHQRLLVAEDVQQYILSAEASTIGR